MDIKQQVREFYNQVGWQEIGEGLYQNATYEDLRPVSREYIHRCHLRVARHLKQQGKYLLDAGSGPIQYPEYLEYSMPTGSAGYQFRVCADISLVALQEARKRIGAHGLFVVADVANLPFKDSAFDGVVSLHTLHHLPLDEQPRAYRELYRLLAPESTAVVVNGWHMPPLTRLANRMIRLVERLKVRKLKVESNGDDPQPSTVNRQPSATYVSKADAAWLGREVGAQMPLEIRVWRTFGVKVLRTFIHDRWGGRFWLRVLYWLEERFPHWLGKNGQYPLIVIRKT